MAFKFAGLLKNVQTVVSSAGIKQVVSITLIFILCEQFNTRKVLMVVIFVQCSKFYLQFLLCAVVLCCFLLRPRIVGFLWPRL